MKIAQAALAVLVCGLLAGCRTRSDYRYTIELLERELREKEDKLYELEYDLETAESDLKACKEEQRSTDDRGEPANGRGGVVLPPGLDEPAPPFQPPRVQPPNNDIPEGDAPRGPRASGPGLPGLIPGKGEPWRDGDFEIPLEEAPIFQGSVRADPAALRIGEDKPSENSQPDEPITDDQVARITLDRKRTGGRSIRRGGAHEQLGVVLEPRNAAGQIVDTPGEVAIVVLDPARTGPAAQVARWDYTIEEIAAAFEQSSPSGGLNLTLAWPQPLPRGGRLNLYVRFTTVDGRQLRAEQPIDIDFVHGRTATWERATRSIPREPPAPVPPLRRVPDRDDDLLTRFSPRFKESHDHPIRDYPRQDHFQTDERPPAANSYPPPPTVRLPTWSPYR